MRTQRQAKHARTHFPRPALGLTSVVLLISGLPGLAQTTGLPDDPANGQRPPRRVDQTSPRRSSMVQRGLPPRAGERDDAMTPPAEPGPTRFPGALRSIDGVGNNVANPTWGSGDVTFLRLADPEYADEVAAPAGADRPGARAISNAVAAQVELIPNPHGASGFLWQWGQFIDHDITETPVADPAEEFDIEVPLGDAWFDPQNTGTAKIGLDRSAYAIEDGVREQINLITAYIDASNVYGAEHERADALRTLDGTGRLRTSDGDFLPYNDVGLANAPSASSDLFLAGDVRANEQVALTAMHTLFVREHNHWADEIAQDAPDLTGDEVYAYARAIVAGEMQAITYREFLPVLLGPGALPPYNGYRPEVNAGISNAFATAAYRLGHSMLSPELQRLDSDGNAIPAGPLPLAGAFFSPAVFLESGMEPLLRGLAAQEAQNIDAYVIDDVRNFLFGPPGAGGFDLVALNLQRGRDHGLPGWNAMRLALGMPPHTEFQQLAADPDVAAGLGSTYASVDDVDLWMGGLAEPHVPGSLVGPTFQAILADQFRRLRDGDRFWYRRYLPPPLVDLVEHQTLSQVIRRNTAIGPELPDNVFRVMGGSPTANLELFAACLTGPDQVPEALDPMTVDQCLAACDRDRDRDVDLADLAEFMLDPGAGGNGRPMPGGGGPPPESTGPLDVDFAAILAEYGGLGSDDSGGE